MDEYERREVERERRNAAVVVELDTVCRQHGARAVYAPSHGVFVLVEDGVRVEWLWSLDARAACVEVQSTTGGTHPNVHPAELARGLARMAHVLTDPAFDTALALALSRTSADSARALMAQQQRRTLMQQGVRYHGD